MNASELKNKKIVCLGGGVGTSNLLRGLKHFHPRFTIITSMADDGGSSGRLRKAYHIMPPGDIIYNIAALIPDDQKEMADLLLYRYPGKNEANTVIDGHKLGNLIMLAEIQRTGDFYKAIEVTKQLFNVQAEFLPATDERTHLSAITKDGRRVHTETALDMALYNQPYGLKKIYSTPKHPNVNKRVAESLMEADFIFSGPGDLYTNQLPVLIIPEIKEALLKSKAKKIFVMNVANKPYETKGFTLKDFLQAITDHLGENPFDIIIANNNYSLPIPEKYDYSYVQVDPELRNPGQSFSIFEGDVVSESFPIYHDFTKLASLIVKNV